MIIKYYCYSVFLAIIMSLLVACSTAKPIMPTPTITTSPTISPSVTPTITLSSTPTITPSSTVSPTPTYLPITPVLQGTYLPQSGAAISLENVDRLTLLARWGQGNPGQVAYTPDGKYFVVGSSTGLYFYNPGDFSLVHYVDTQAAVFHLAISPDGQIIATVVHDKVLLYQISDWKLASTIQVNANSVDFSPDGKILALGINLDPGYLQLRDTETGTLIQEFKNEQGAWAVKMSPRGDVIATGGFSTSIWALDGTMTDQYGPYVSGGGTTSVSFSPDGEFLAEASDNSLRIWRVLENGRLINYRQIDLSRCDDASVFDVAISPNGMLVAATLSNGVCVWDLTTGARIFYGASGSGFTFYSSLAWSMDSRTIAITSGEMGVQVWNIDTGESLASLNAHSGSFSSLVWSPDGQKLAAGAEEGTAYLFNVQNGNVIQHFGPGYELNSLAFSPNSQNLAVGYGDRTVQIWNLDGTILQTLEGFGYGSSDATFSADGSLFAAILPESWETPPQVRFWDARDWKVEKTFPVGDRDNFMITGFVLAPDQLTGAISYVNMNGYYRDFIQIISIADGTLITTFEPKGNRYRVGIDSMAYSPNGSLLAILTSEFDDPNPHLLVWQTSDWVLLYEQTIVVGSRLGRATNQQDSIVWSPDSMLLAIGTKDGNIQILRSLDGERLATLIGHTLWVTGVTFSPDGRTLASTSLDGTLRLWGIR